MLNGIKKQMNISSISTVENERGERVPVSYMNATIQDDGKPGFGQSIDNLSLYAVNTSEVDNDFSEFKKAVMEEVGRYAQKNS